MAHQDTDFGTDQDTGAGPGGSLTPTEAKAKRKQGRAKGTTTPTGKTRKETAEHLQAFEAWYQEGRSFRRCSQKITVSEYTLYDWASYFGWHDRADDRDDDLRHQLETRATQDKLARLQEQLTTGTLMRVRGAKHLMENDIENTRDALRAVQLGIDIERKCDGLPDWVVKIMGATPEEMDAIQQELEELESGHESGQ